MLRSGGPSPALTTSKIKHLLLGASLHDSQCGIFACPQLAHVRRGLTSAPIPRRRVVRGHVIELAVLEEFAILEADTGYAQSIHSLANEVARFFQSESAEISVRPLPTR